MAVRGRWDGARAALPSAVDVVARPQRALRRAPTRSSPGAQQGGIARAAARHRALRALRAFFDASGFIEVETPAVVRSPGLELHLEALEVIGAGEPRYLHTSPEYHMKRLLAAGMSRIYQLVQGLSPRRARRRCTSPSSRCSSGTARSRAPSS